MQKCSYCGANLPENSRFCGTCGSVQDAIAPDAAATRSNTQQPQSRVPEDGTMLATWSPYSNYPAQGSAPAGSPSVQAPETPLPPPAAENEDERRRDIPPWSPLYGAALAGDALLGSGQISTPGAPVVQGTPQIGSVPGVAGSSTPYTNAPAAPPTHGAGNAAPVSHPVQGAGNAAPDGPPTQGSAKAPSSHPVHKPVSHPVHKPVSHPVHKPVKPPVNHPVLKPVSHPVQEPEQSGTEEHHPPHRHHDHPRQHVHHTAAHVTKVAGGSTVKTIIIVVTAVVVVAAGAIGAATHFLSHSQPFISITSNYNVGNTPAGANGTVLHISGQQFASNAAITILLDGTVAPGNPGTRSDSNGNFSTDITITGAWSAGTHTLTARDASNVSTKNSVSVTIVRPGQANIPGPNGAPPDDASFKLNITFQGPYSDIADPFAINPMFIITGHPDPEGGTVCSPDDNGQPFTRSGTTVTNSDPYTGVFTATCSGTYKAGQVSYIETDTSVHYSYQSNGINVNCVQNNSAVDLTMSGAYTGNGTFSGTFNAPDIPYTCDQQGYSFHQVALQGTWTGTIVTQ